MPIRVNIEDPIYIPGIGKGPVHNVEISETHYQNLVHLKYGVKVVSSTSRFVKANPYLGSHVSSLDSESPVEASESVVAPVEPATSEEAPSESSEAPVVPESVSVESASEAPVEPATSEEVPVEASESVVAPSESPVVPDPTPLTDAEKEETKTATNDRIKEILTSHNIQFKYNSTKDDLLALAGAK